MTTAAARLAAEREGVPDPGALDRLARLAARALRAPVVLVTVRDEAALVVTGQSGAPGVAGGEVPEGAFGRREESGVARADPGALRDTWEADTFGAQSALGVPVTAGQLVGALVILDVAARVWTEEEVEAAGELAAAVSAELDRRDAHRRLRTAERYQAVLERSPEAILVQVDGVIRFANAAAAMLLGVSHRNDLVGRRIDAFLAEPYLKEVEHRLVGEEPPDGPPPVSEEKLTRADGTVRDVEVASLAYMGGDAPAVQMFLRDMTARRQAREALRARETQLRLLLERIPALFWTTDLSLRMELVRGGAPLSAEAGVVGAYFGKGEDSVPVTTHRRALGGESASDIMQWAGGTYEVRVEPLWDERGAVCGTAGIAVDTTVRRRIEAREQEERGIDALGRVAGGVAHGINNTLATIVGLTSVLLRVPALPEPVQRNLRAILGAGGRAHALTSDLLGFARQGQYRTVRIDINGLATEAAELARDQRPVVVDLAPDLPMVEGDLDQLRDAVLHVCQNAVDATRAGGGVWISTYRARLPGGGEHQVAPGLYACLDIRDTGTGMSEEVRARAIEPFFTTREFGSGSGMGLSMAFGVLRQHGGDLRIVSAPGVGTTVTLCAPVVEPHVAPPVARSEGPRRDVERGAVLVVDDDPWVLESSSQLLETLGYEPVPAHDGPTALRLFEQAPRPFAFVLLDLRMPGMDGEEVLRRLLAVDPQVRVILCTGYERYQVSQPLFGLGHVGFLGKPFTVKQLQEQLAELGVETV